MVGPSINIRLRKLEGVLDQLESRFVFMVENDFDDVEAERDLGIIQKAKPCECAL